MFPTLLLAIGLNFGSNTSEPQAPSGVTVSFSDGTSQRDMPTRLFAARVEAGEAPAIGIAPTGWTGVFSGTLNLPIRTRAELGLRGTGSAVLSIDGEAVLNGGLESTLQTKQLRLNKGSRSINLNLDAPKRRPGLDSTALGREGLQSGTHSNPTAFDRHRPRQHRTRPRADRRTPLYRLSCVQSIHIRLRS